MALPGEEVRPARCAIALGRVRLRETVIAVWFPAHGVAIFGRVTRSFEFISMALLA